MLTEPFPGHQAHSLLVKRFSAAPEGYPPPPPPPGALLFGAHISALHISAPKMK